jgi:hypothetical protein
MLAAGDGDSNGDCLMLLVGGLGPAHAPDSPSLSPRFAFVIRLNSVFIDLASFCVVFLFHRLRPHFLQFRDMMLITGQYC